MCSKTYFIVLTTSCEASPRERRCRQCRSSHFSKFFESGLSFLSMREFKLLLSGWWILLFFFVILITTCRYLKEHINGFTCFSHFNTSHTYFALLLTTWATYWNVKVSWYWRSMQDWTGLCITWPYSIWKPSGEQQVETLDILFESRIMTYTDNIHCFRVSSWKTLP